MKKKYDEAKVIKLVSKKCNVDYSTRVIFYDPTTGNVGNGTLGKLDFLAHYCGWTVAPRVGATASVKQNVDTSIKKKKEKKEVDTLNPKNNKKKKK